MTKAPRLLLWLSIPAWVLIFFINFWVWGNALIFGPVLELRSFKLVDKNGAVWEDRRSSRLRNCPSDFVFYWRNGHEYYIRERRSHSTQIRNNIRVFRPAFVLDYMEPAEYYLVVDITHYCPFSVPFTEEWVSENTVRLP